MTILLGKGEQLPFLEKTFDVIVSKYALQTSTNIRKYWKKSLGS